MPQHHRGSGRWLHSVLVAAACVCASYSPISAGIDPALVAAAENEGQLVVYGGDVSETPVQIKRFMELYPKIKTTSAMAGSWQLYNRFIAENNANKPVADVFFATDDTLYALNDGGHFAPTVTKEAANFDGAALRGANNYYLTKVIIAGMVSNTQYMKGIKPPTDWTSFASPSKDWNGLVSFFDPRTSSGAFMVMAALHQNFGQEKAAAIYRGLMATNAELSSTTPAGVSKLLSGEKPIMYYMLTNHFGDAVKKGAPLDFRIPESGAVPFYMGLGVLKTAPHPNAARLFVEYMLTEGQKVIASRDEYALRKGSAPPKGLPPLNEVKLLKLDVPAALRDQKDLLKWWSGVTGIN